LDFNLFGLNFVLGVNHCVSVKSEMLEVDTLLFLAEYAAFG